MIERRIECAGLSVLAIGDPRAERVVIFLHGRSMEAADLAPFAHALGIDAYFLFPDAPLPMSPHGYSWWPVDPEMRAARLAAGPSDLFEVDPPEREPARAALAELCAAQGDARRIVLVGFSQGGMLAMDSVLHGLRPLAMALLSTSRIAFDDWIPRLPLLKGLPVLVSHGKADRELAFAAGEAVCAAARRGGAEVTWHAHDEGHEIPLRTWRALKRFIVADFGFGNGGTA